MQSKISSEELESCVHGAHDLKAAALALDATVEDLCEKGEQCFNDLTYVYKREALPNLPYTLQRNMSSTKSMFQRIQSSVDRYVENSESLDAGDKSVFDGSSDSGMLIQYYLEDLRSALKYCSEDFDMFTKTMDTLVEQMEQLQWPDHPHPPSQKSAKQHQINSKTSEKNGNISRLSCWFSNTVFGNSESAEHVNNNSSTSSSNQQDPIVHQTTRNMNETPSTSTGSSNLSTSKRPSANKVKKVNTIQYQDFVDVNHKECIPTTSNNNLAARKCPSDCHYIERIEYFEKAQRVFKQVSAKSGVLDNFHTLLSREEKRIKYLNDNVDESYIN